MILEVLCDSFIMVDRMDNMGIEHGWLRQREGTIVNSWQKKMTVLVVEMGSTQT